jgi:hypothetical protein
VLACVLQFHVISSCPNGVGLGRQRTNSVQGLFIGYVRPVVDMKVLLYEILSHEGGDKGEWWRG